MKSISTVFTFILLHIAIAAKTQTFSFSQAAKPYTNLTGDTIIPKKSYYDTINIGFEYTIAGTKSDKIVHNRGWGSFFSFGNNNARFIFYGTELTNGTYSYKLEGAPGNRIFKFQGKNVGFGHDFSFQDYINVQVWLYEADNSLEVYFGKSLVQNMDFDFYFGMGGPAVGFKGMMLTGNANVPTVTNADTARVTGTPSNGKMYSFKVSNLSVKEQEKQPAFRIYPNPATRQIALYAEDETVQIYFYDITGRQQHVNYTRNSNSYIADISVLPVGLYEIKISGEHGVQVQKLIVQH